MTSPKFLTNGTVLNVLNSFNKRPGQQCKICLGLNTPSCSNGPGYDQRSTFQFTRRGFTSTQVIKNNNPTTSISNNNRIQTNNVITRTGIHLASSRNFRRHSSTTPSTNQLATEITKRDASTQARQRVKEKPHYPNYNEIFRSSELEIIKCPPSELKPKPPIDKLLFGHAFTDHMFRVDWDHENGWSTPLISKLHNLDLHPGAKVFHYAVEAFEGTKAYRGYDNKIRFFRLDQNIRRLLQSTRRLALPDFDEEELIKCIHKLVQLDQDWIPGSKGYQHMTSLYLRPTILGVEPSLGVASSKKAILYVLLSPVGPYFKTGFKPVSLYADPDVVRAWPGGAGCSKLGSNYAPTIMVQKEAESLGFQQVLWLYGEEERLTEVGTMNIFVSYMDKTNGKIRLVTPPIDDGLVLPGITRRSILELASRWDDVICEERYQTISDIQNLIDQGELLEIFGAGTACVVCPVNSIHIKDGRVLKIPNHNITEMDQQTEEDSTVITTRILKAITDIQFGYRQHPWAQELTNED